MKLLALDGNSIINRAFYGIRLLSTKDGQYTNAVYGFINILNNLIESEKPDGVAVAFDLKKPTFRHKIYADYKAGRHPMPEELKEQFPLLKEWLTLAGYNCIECEGYEADDILGTLARLCRESKNECVIATGDRDSLQLISENTRVLLTVTKMGRPEITDYTVEVLKEKYGLAPKEMIELKALMGDSSDNLPGVAGVGQKTATDLILKYSNIDYIYENIDSLDIKSGVKEKLKADKDNAYLSRELGTICTAAPINEDLKEYLIKDRQSGLAPFMTKLELFSLMKKMGIEPSAQIKTEKTETKEFTPCEYKAIKELKTVDVFENFAAGENKVCRLSDTELKEILTDEKISKRVYDYKNLSKKYTDIKGVTFDLMLAAYILNPNGKDYSAERIFAEYSVSTTVNDDSFKSGALFSAACDVLTKELIKTEQFELLKNIEVPLARVLGEMESYGFLVDTDGLKKMGDDLFDRTEEIKAEIYTIAGEEFNVNSPKQLGVILFEKLGIPTKKKTKSGYSTSADVLEGLRGSYKIVDLVLNYRQLSKLKSTYCDGLVSAVKEDGRIHTTFNQTEARTGRISSLEPNLQNIPVRTEEGKKLREFFVAKEGYTLCDADYSQIELRVLASLADDNEMIKAFESGTDIHTVTASQVFNIPESMVLPIMRSRAKAVNFGIVYGIGAFSLGKDIGVSRAEADQYIKNYLSTYKGVAAYMDKVIEKAKEDGFVTTAFGRRRYLPELKEKNGMMRAFGERVARNAPIQGTAADIIKIAMIKVRDRLIKELPSAHLILQVHDELIVECKSGDAQKVKIILEEEMQTAAELKVKLTAEAGSGKNWLAAKG